jgi:lysozyme
LQKCSNGCDNSIIAFFRIADRLFNGQKMNLTLIKKHEGLKLSAYLCPAKVPTIGYGNTFYENGTRVKMGDKITRDRAEKLLQHIVEAFSVQVDRLVTAKINDNQRSALVSFAYNLGIGSLQKSTLLKKVNANPNDPAIRIEFMKWTKARGVVLRGLVIRRQDEANLYFKTQ